MVNLLITEAKEILMEKERCVSDSKRWYNIKNEAANQCP